MEESDNNNEFVNAANTNIKKTDMEFLFPIEKAATESENDDPKIDCSSNGITVFELLQIKINFRLHFTYPMIFEAQLLQKITEMKPIVWLMWNLLIIFQMMKILSKSGQ